MTSAVWRATQAGRNAVIDAAYAVETGRSVYKYFNRSVIRGEN